MISREVVLLPCTDSEKKWDTKEDANGAWNKTHNSEAHNQETTTTAIIYM